MNDEYFIEQFRRVRGLAEMADPFTKKRLAAVLAPAAPANNTHIDQLFSVGSSMTRLIAMLAIVEQPGCCRISSNARHRKAWIESRVFAIRGLTSKC